MSRLLTRRSLRRVTAVPPEVKVLTFRGTDNSTLDFTNYSFNSMPIGAVPAAGRNRYVIAAPMTQLGTYPTSVTIGGISAVRQTTAQMHIASVPTGNLANIEVVYPIEQSFGCMIGVWTFEASAITYFNSLFDNNNFQGSVIANNNGFVVWATLAWLLAGGDASCSFDNAFVERDEIWDGGVLNAAFADRFYAVGIGPTTVSSTWTAVDGSSVQYMSFY